MSDTITLSIQEIINDFYQLGETEGYLTGLSEGFELTEKDMKNYFDFMVNMAKKYIPKTFENYISKDEDYVNNGMELSSALFNNFKEIFCKLI